jgi:hypothetical protein
MHCDLCLRNGLVYLPTMGKMGDGFYRGVEPVAVVPASDTESLRRELLAMIDRGNPTVPMLKRREWPPPVVLKHAGVKTWSAFEHGMLLWSIEEKDGAFRIAGQKKQPDRMWRDDPELIITFPSGTATNQVVERMIAVLQDAAGRQSPATISPQNAV